MIKKWIAGFMSLAMVAACIYAEPIASKAATNVPGNIAKINASGYKSADSKGIRFSWSKVTGAKGYQYKYDLFYGTKDSNEKTKSTKKTAVKISFQDHKNIRFRVRAFKTKTSGGKTKRVYGQWISKTFTQGQVEDLFTSSDSSNLGGTWKDASHNASMTIVDRDGLFQMEITRKVSAYNGTRWSFFGRFIGSSNVIELSSGIRESLTYDANGNIVSAVEKESGLSGTMTYDSSGDSLIWNGSVEFTGLDSDMVFSKQ